MSVQNRRVSSLLPMPATVPHARPTHQDVLGRTVTIALRGLGFAVKVAALGMCFIGVFVLARASSFHRVDAFLGQRLVHLSMNWLLEMGGIVIMLGAALLRVRSAAARSRENLGMTTRPAI
jgi:hypothetical protein